MLPILTVLALSVSPATPTPDTDEFICLAKNIYFEARDEPLAGKYAVAQVTINRSHSKGFPSSVCAVVYQKNPRGCQFSWVCEHIHPIDSAEFAQAKLVASRMLQGFGFISTLRRALYFHEYYVSPKWKEDMRFLTRIGGHLFYASS